MCVQVFVFFLSVWFSPKGSLLDPLSPSDAFQNCFTCFLCISVHLCEQILLLHQVTITISGLVKSKALQMTASQVKGSWNHQSVTKQRSARSNISTASSSNAGNRRNVRVVQLGCQNCQLTLFPPSVIHSAAESVS